MGKGAPFLDQVWRSIVCAVVTGRGIAVASVVATVGAVVTGRGIAVASGIVVKVIGHRQIRCAVVLAANDRLISLWLAP